MKTPPLPIPNPRYQNNEEQYTPTLGQYTKAYAPGLGVAMGIALMGLFEAASEMRKNNKPSYGDRRMARWEAEYNDRMKQRRLVQAQDDLYRMRKLNPKVMTKAEKKYRNKVIKDAERTIKTGSPRSFGSKVVGQVATKAGPAAALFTLLDFMQGTPAGEGSAKFGPGARKR